MSPGEVAYASPEAIAKVTARSSRPATAYRDRLEGVSIKNPIWVVKPGTALVEILRYARENSIDVIMLGAAGISAQTKIHYGSTVEQVSRWAPLPHHGHQAPRAGFSSLSF